MSSFGTAPAKGQPLSVVRPTATVAELIGSVFPEDLVAAAGHGSLSEDLALAILHRNDLPAAAIETLARNQIAVTSRKVLLRLVQHGKAPRHISLPLLRRLFAFELMDVALSPAVAPDLKLIAEQLLIDKLKTISLGERINLARRASSGIAAALLLQGERLIIEAALQNPRMTEASIVKCLGHAEVPAVLIFMLAENAKWSLRREIQLAILRRPETPEPLASRIARMLPKSAIYGLLKDIRLPQRKQQLLRRLTGA